MTESPTALIAWSTGKDSAFALHRVVSTGGLRVAGLLTTLRADEDTVAVHGVPEALLDRQAESLGLPVTKVRVPPRCSNAEYEREVGRALADARHRGVTHVVFGDLQLADVRAYREGLLAALGLRGVFPLWLCATSTLAREMLALGLQATVTCVDTRRLGASFAGRAFDAALLAALPAGVDPCGENGEFHTFATAGPMFRAPIAVEVGPRTERDGFAFAGVRPATPWALPG
jgi:uncharacterized protein (TIGR00290 family)